MCLREIWWWQYHGYLRHCSIHSVLLKHISQKLETMDSVHWYTPSRGTIIINSYLSDWGEVTVAAASWNFQLREERETLVSWLVTWLQTFQEPWVNNWLTNFSAFFYGAASVSGVVFSRIRWKDDHEF
jgi:hypothetical protein